MINLINLFFYVRDGALNFLRYHPITSKLAIGITAASIHVAVSSMIRIIPRQHIIYAIAAQRFSCHTAIHNVMHTSEYIKTVAAFVVTRSIYHTYTNAMLENNPAAQLMTHTIVMASGRLTGAG